MVGALGDVGDEKFLGRNARDRLRETPALITFIAYTAQEAPATKQVSSISRSRPIYFRLGNNRGATHQFKSIVGLLVESPVSFAPVLRPSPSILIII